MLIALYWFIKHVLFPDMEAFASEIFDPIMYIVITLAGIVMVFGAVGMRISSNLGSTIVGGIFRACGYVVRTIVRGTGWAVRHFFGMIPRLFTGSRKTFTDMGANPILANVLSIVIVILVVIVII